LSLTFIWNGNDTIIWIYIIRKQTSNWVRKNGLLQAEPWLRRLDAGLSPGRPGSRLGQSMRNLWWIELHWDRFVFVFFGFSLSVSFHRGSIVTYRLGNEE
jgi:hypothetical protein